MQFTGTFQLFLSLSSLIIIAVKAEHSWSFVNLFSVGKALSELLSHQNITQIESPHLSHTACKNRPWLRWKGGGFLNSFCFCCSRVFVFFFLLQIEVAVKSNRLETLIFSGWDLTFLYSRTKACVYHCNPDLLGSTVQSLVLCSWVSNFCDL